MKYIGEFRDLNNVLYKIEIITKNDTSQETSLLMSGEDTCVIEYKGSNYIKSSLCTIKVLTSEPYFDINDAFGNRVKVRIYKEGVLFWVGYATPNAYSQGFEMNLDSYEIETQDAISTLKYFNYQAIEPYNNGTNYAKSMLIPFGNGGYENPISETAIKEATSINPCVNLFSVVTNILQTYVPNDYKEIFVTSSIYVPTAKDLSLLDALYISERNFFDEDAKPMKCNEVIEEICKILGLILVPYGDKLYFINRESIAHGMNYYHHYKFEDFWYYSGLKKEGNVIDITKDKFRGGGSTNISLSSVYNKAKVKADHYPKKSFMPNIKDDSLLVYSNYIDNAAHVDFSNELLTTDPRSGKSLENGEIIMKNERDEKHLIFMKYYGLDWTSNFNNRLIFYHYHADKEGPFSNDYNEDGSNYSCSGEVAAKIPYNTREFSYRTTKDFIGGCLVDYAVKKVDDWTSFVSSVDYERAIYVYCDSYWNKPQKVYKARGVFSEPTQKGAIWVRQGYQKIFDLVSDFVVLSKNQYIVFSGKFKYFYDRDLMPIEKDDAKISGKFAFEWATLQFGKYYWNGTEWQKNFCYFKLPLNDSSDKRAWNSDVEIRNNVDYSTNLKEKGYCIPPPKFREEDRENDTELAMIGRLIFTFYRPSGVSEGVCRSCLIKDFDMKICGLSDGVINDKEDGTEYENVIEEGAIEEYESTTCKISSSVGNIFGWDNLYFIDGFQDGNNHSSSPISFINAEDSFFLSDGREIKMVAALGGEERFNYLRFKRLIYLYDVSSGEYLRPEQQIISRAVKHYIKPNLILTTDLNSRNDISLLSKVNYSSQFGKTNFVVKDITYSLGDSRVTITIENYRTHEFER